MFMEGEQYANVSRDWRYNMEKLINCEFCIEISIIDKICGGNQCYDVFFTDTNGAKYKLTFDFVWDIRCSIENAYIDRFTKFKHCEEKESNILLVQNSDCLRYFEEQISGTRPTNEIKDYIIFDRIDTVIELLTIRSPILTRIVE